MVLLGLQAQLLFKLILNLIFAASKLFNFVVHHQFLACDLLLQLFDPLSFVIARGLLTDIRCVRIFRTHQVVE